MQHRWTINYFGCGKMNTRQWIQFCLYWVLYSFRSVTRGLLGQSRSMPPSFVVPRKNVKHMIKTKFYPPKNVFSPNLETRLRLFGPPSPKAHGCFRSECCIDDKSMSAPRVNCSPAPNPCTANTGLDIPQVPGFKMAWSNPPHQLCWRVLNQLCHLDGYTVGWTLQICRHLVKNVLLKF